MQRTVVPLKFILILYNDSLTAGRNLLLRAGIHNSTNKFAFSFAISLCKLKSDVTLSHLRIYTIHLLIDDIKFSRFCQVSGSSYLAFLTMFSTFKNGNLNISLPLTFKVTSTAGFLIPSKYSRS